MAADDAPTPHGASTAGAGRRAPLIEPALLFVAFWLAVGLRVLLGGDDVAHSALAGWTFGVVLSALALGYRTPAAWSPRAVAVGLLGAAVLCLPVVLARSGATFTDPDPAGSFLAWALPVTLVAAAEEAFLRGALYEAVQQWRSENLAIAVTTVCFALLHVPLYGWGAVPLDLAVGVWFAVLRRVTGGWAAPAVAHVAADYAAWWL